MISARSALPFFTAAIPSEIDFARLTHARISGIRCAYLTIGVVCFLSDYEIAVNKWDATWQRNSIFNVAGITNGRATRQKDGNNCRCNSHRFTLTITTAANNTPMAKSRFSPSSRVCVMATGSTVRLKLSGIKGWHLFAPDRSRPGRNFDCRGRHR